MLYIFLAGIYVLSFLACLMPSFIYPEKLRALFSTAKVIFPGILIVLLVVFSFDPIIGKTSMGSVIWSFALSVPLLAIASMAAVFCQIFLKKILKKKLYRVMSAAFFIFWTALLVSEAVRMLCRINASGCYI